MNRDGYTTDPRGPAPNGSIVGWTGGDWDYHAKGRFVMYGPQIVRSCVTKTGARLAAWRLRVKGRGLR